MSQPGHIGCLCSGHRPAGALIRGIELRPVLSSSRLGFRGVEDLGGGLKASFWLEGALAVDTGTQPLASIDGGRNNAAGIFQRRATVSLMGGFGELRLGRDKVPTNLTWDEFDPFRDTGVGRSSRLGQCLGRACGVPSTLLGMIVPDAQPQGVLRMRQRQERVALRRGHRPALQCQAARRFGRQGPCMARLHRDQIALGSHVQHHRFGHLGAEEGTQGLRRQRLVGVVDAALGGRTLQPRRQVAEVVQPCGECQFRRNPGLARKASTLPGVLKLRDAFAFIAEVAALGEQGRDLFRTYKRSLW